MARLEVETFSLISGGGIGWGRTGEETMRRLGDTGARPKKTKTRGSAVCSGRVLQHKDAAVEPFNNFTAGSDSFPSPESDGKNVLEELRFHLDKYLTSLLARVSTSITGSTIKKNNFLKSYPHWKELKM